MQSKLHSQSKTNFKVSQGVPGLSFILIDTEKEMAMYIDKFAP